jgi:AAA15 family ATPase/GTPase
MLIRFRVENFLSFNKPAEISFLPGAARSHKNHVIRGKGSNDIHILKAGIIYGANASGKSNLIKAIDFARKLILNGTRPDELIHVIPFRLDKDREQDPSMFEFEFKTIKSCFNYGFKLSATRVEEEWLYEINKDSEKLLFERTTEQQFAKIKFNFRGLSQDKEFLNFVARGTRANQLFLTECIERNVDAYSDAFGWFKNCLQIIFPESRSIGPFFTSKVDESSEQNFQELLIKYLKLFDTGIRSFDYQPVDPEKEFPEKIFKSLKTQLKIDQPAFVGQRNGSRYLVKIDKENPSEISALKMQLSHSGKSQDVTLDFEDESDGTIRLLDLVPILEKRSIENSRVYLIDELDRSIHPLICKEIIRQFLCQPGNNQLIATTHQPLLLDLDLLRRDEVWFIEKDSNGASELYSLEEFSPRYDNDIEKGYLLGRFGAIPVVAETVDDCQ